MLVLAQASRMKTGGFGSTASQRPFSDLATLIPNEIPLPDQPDHRFLLLAAPTKLQEEAFRILDIKPHRVIPVETQA